jgi:glycosyltransferase involved in cell wall biosynthesis
LKGGPSVGSSRVRAIQFFDFIEENEIKVVAFKRTDQEKSQLKMFFWISFLISSLFSSYVFLQKPVLNRFVIISLKLIRVKVISDFDDAIWINSKGYDLFENPANQFGTNIIDVLKISKFVICGSDYLMNCIKNKFTEINCFVLRPSVFLLENFQIECHKSIVVGWIGNSVNLAELEFLIPSFKYLKKEKNITILVCTDFLTEVFLGVVDHIPWSLKNEELFLSYCSIGIMPLKQDLRSLGRCGYKAIQYMSNGIPVIASDSGISKELIKDGINGLLCNSPSDWQNSILVLANDIEKRIKFGLAGRNFVEMYCNSCANQQILLKIFKDT